MAFERWEDFGREEENTIQVEAGWEEKPVMEKRPRQQEAGRPAGGGRAWETGQALPAPSGRVGSPKQPAGL